MKESYRNFRVTSRTDLPEIQATLVELVHEKTGAKLLHLATEDDENLFCISLCTRPSSSNGVAHILEHTVLCGSSRFPVKDPFFSMGRRSLNTFMNAFTGSDFTSYPASSQIKSDFYNLLDVYADAIFHPLLTPLSFLQEGHRLEFAEDGSLIIKGIVYNEMKGALASGEARLGEVLMESLFPTLTYGKNSGGNPREIPHLTHAEMKQFHRTFYHPSRALFFFYGNIPLEEHVDFLEERVLKDVSPLPPLAPLSMERPLLRKVVRTEHYPILASEGDIEEKTLVALGFLTASILDQEEVLALNVLDLVLMGTDAAPLKMALLKSQLCKVVDSSLEDEMSQVPYLILCKGCKNKAAPLIEKLISETLEKVAIEGFSPALVEGAVHQIEMSRKEISSPYGLTLYFRAALLKQQGGKPEDALMIHTLFNRLRAKLKDGSYLPTLIRKYLLNNTHSALITMLPDTTLEKKEQQEEEEMLAKRKEHLTKEERELIIKTAKELEAYQDKEEDLSSLPTVLLTDIPTAGKEFELHKERYGHLTLFHHPTFTNGILYAELVFDLPDMEAEQLPFLKLFSLFLPLVGAGGRTYAQNLDYLFAHTGGVASEIDLCFQADDCTHIKPAFLLKGKALHGKADKLFSFFTDVVSSADFTDQQRIGELLKEHVEELEGSIASSPMRFAIYHAASALSTPLAIRNALSGLLYFWKLKKIKEEFEKEPSTLIEMLTALQKKILALKTADLVLTCEQTLFETLKGETLFSLSEALVRPYTPWKGTNLTLPRGASQGRITANAVAFSAWVLPSVCYTDPATPYLSLAAKIMENTSLHKKIREQGGAYGSGASHVALSGYFLFHAYRDPHLSSTWKAFEEAIYTMAQGDFDEEDLQEAKLEIIQDLDAPFPPGARGGAAYDRLRGGRSAKRRQEYRERLLMAKKEDVIEAVRTHLASAQGTFVTMAGETLLDKEKALVQERSLPIFPLFYSEP